MMDAGKMGDGKGCARQLRFEGHVLDLANRELRRAGQPVELGSRYFDALALLVSEAGSLVSKDRFMAEVWRGIPVTDEALTQCIRTLRRALGDTPGAPRFIQTVPKHGYRFVAPVAAASGEAASVTAVSGASRLAGASTIGGGLAGLAGGLVYGLAGTASGGGTILVLVALGAALGVLGGAGVGLGMALARGLKPGAQWPLAAGGALGGLLVGGLGQALSLDGVALLTGAALGPVTGLFEGAMLGLAAALATIVALHDGSLRPRLRLALAGLIGGGAGVAVSLAGGRLFGASLFELQQRLPRSGLALDRIGPILGDRGFGPGSMLIATALEAAVFVAGVAAANFLLRRR